MGAVTRWVWFAGTVLTVIGEVWLVLIFIATGKLLALLVALLIPWFWLRQTREAQRDLARDRGDQWQDNW